MSCALFRPISIGLALFTAVLISKGAGAGEFEGALSTIYEGDAFFEGPSWDAATGSLYFTAFPHQSASPAIFRMDRTGIVEKWIEEPGGANGTFISEAGFLYAALSRAHRLVRYRIGAEGSRARETLAEGKWSQPNDLFVTRKGDIYFTDPDFQKRRDGSVYRRAVNGTVSRVAQSPLPNGVLLSPDEKTLYLSDSELRRWISHDVGVDGTLGPPRVFFDPSLAPGDDPDGMTVDEKGTLYLCGRGGLWVVSALGEAKDFLSVPSFCSNVAFGGDDWRTLFITGDRGVYRVTARAKGAGIFRARRG